MAAKEIITEYKNNDGLWSFRILDGQDRLLADSGDMGYVTKRLMLIALVAKLVELGATRE